MRNRIRLRLPVAAAQRLTAGQGVAGVLCLVAAAALAAGPAAGLAVAGVALLAGAWASR